MLGSVWVMESNPSRDAFLGKQGFSREPEEEEAEWVWWEDRKSCCKDLFRKVCGGVNSWRKTRLRSREQKTI